MRTRSLVGVIMVVSTLCLVFSSLWLRAQHPLSPHPDFADALWLAHSDGIRKIAADAATVLFTMSDANDVWALAVDAHPDVRALAVDVAVGSVWVGLHKGLRHYDATGALRFEFHLDKLTTLESDP